MRGKKVRVVIGTNHFNLCDTAFD